MSTRESQGSQEFADGTWKLTLRGFPGWRVGVGSYLVHPLDPELAHQDLQSGHEWNGQEDPHDAEERAHYQDGEDYRAGCRSTARLITIGWRRLPSICWMITKARITQTTEKGSEIRARSTGITIEISAPR